MTAFLLFSLVLIGSAFAQDASAIGENIVDSTDQLPALIAAISYLLGLVLGAWGLWKLKEHIEQPSQTPLRAVISRLLIGAAFLALPIIYEAMAASINGGQQADFDHDIFAPTNFFSGLLGSFSNLGNIGITHDFNAILGAIIDSLSDIPGLITAAAYLIGLVFGAVALWKLKEHIEDPERNPLKEAVVRFLIGGAFLAIPSIYIAMATAISGDADTVGLEGILSDALGSLGLVDSGYDTSNSCLTSAMNGSTIGSMMCGLIFHTSGMPAFLNAISYLIGLVFGFMALLKIRDHVLSPQNTPVSQGVARLAAGGAFFSLPFVIEAVRSTVTPVSATATSFLATLTGGGAVTGYNAAGVNCASGAGSLVTFGTNLLNSLLGYIGISLGGGSSSAVTASGLDGRMYCAVTDLLGPLHSVLNFFTLCAGIIFIMIGISRLLKSEQDGPKAPNGIGTAMTFLTGGLLISFSDFMRLITTTLFSSSTTATYAELQYTVGMTGAELAHVHMVVSAILKFMIMVGLLSFARGIFIIRSVSEGNNQASIMAGVTHIVGGALAVNLGPLLNAVQSTLGINGFGIAFS